MLVDLLFKVKAVIHGVFDLLLAPKIALRCLHRYMPEKKLDLLELATRNMTKAGARAAKVVGRDFFEACLFGKRLYDVPDHLLSQPSSPNDSALIDRSEYAAIYDIRRSAPVVYSLFDPVGDRYRTDMTTFANEIHDGPVILALLNVIHGEVHKFRPPQPAPEKHAKYGSVSLAAQSFRFRCVNQPASLFRCQPVAEPHAKLLHTFDPADTRREFRAQQSCVRSLVGQTSHGG
jgi:hypothetical protein